jgi:hypothetical protein
MDWQTKFAALNALAECSIKMRKPGDWYVSQSVDIKDKSILKSVCGNGDTPEAAVADHWNQVTVDLTGHEYLVCREYWEGEVCKRLAVRWNGFMWDHVQERNPAPPAAA